MWTERASWVVTILALVAGLIQLTLVLRELRRSAKITTGLVVPDGAPRPDNLATNRTIATPWVFGAYSSSEIKVGFGIANSGRRTALDLYHELVFPRAIRDARSVDGDSYRDAVGLVHIVWGPDDLNPRSGLTHYAFVRVPRDTTDCTVTVRVMFRDAKALQTDQARLAFQARP